MAQDTVDISAVQDLGGEARASLIIYDPSGVRVVALASDADFVFGRLPEATVGAEDPSLSRQHARFFHDADAPWVEDLGSKNGTKVNGERIERARLHPGDEITMGNVTASLHVHSAAEHWIKSEPGERIIESSAMRAVYDTADRIARAMIPVLIVGETGSGKEIVARTIHERSDRSSRPMACINCGAIPAQLVESTLFGHERGAFTGADRRQKGAFEAGSGGTVFLDEIGELPAPAQAALLRVLETNRITRVGSPAEIDVDVRIIAATHRDLEAMCDTGAFRRDLLYRLNAVTLKVPPLRQRIEEIRPLASHFLKESRRRMPNVSARTLSDDAAAKLVSHSWPGNVRELRNVIDRAVLVARGDAIEATDLPDTLESLHSPEGVVVAEEPYPDFKAQMRNAEIDIIVRALERTEWNQTAAARLLQMPLRTLVHKIKALEIRNLKK